jgi:hypothetical protein
VQLLHVIFLHFHRICQIHLRCTHHHHTSQLLNAAAAVTLFFNNSFKFLNHFSLLLDKSTSTLCIHLWRKQNSYYFLGIFLQKVHKNMRRLSLVFAMIWQVSHAWKLSLPVLLHNTLHILVFALWSEASHTPYSSFWSSYVHTFDAKSTFHLKFLQQNIHDLTLVSLFWRFYY